MQGVKLRKKPAQQSITRYYWEISSVRSLYSMLEESLFWIRKGSLRGPHPDRLSVSALLAWYGLKPSLHMWQWLQEGSLSLRSWFLSTARTSSIICTAWTPALISLTPSPSTLIPIRATWSSPVKSSFPMSSDLCRLPHLEERSESLNYQL